MCFICLFHWTGKATGIITNTRITHATPAALYGHSPSRYWEDDSKVPPSSRKSCKDLARQLIEDDPGRNINVSITTGVYIRGMPASLMYVITSALCLQWSKLTLMLSRSRRSRNSATHTKQTCTPFTVPVKVWTISIYYFVSISKLMLVCLWSWDKHN